MRRQLNREETYEALYMFYIQEKSLLEISTHLRCTIYDLSPWIIEVGTKIVLGLPSKNPDLQHTARLLDDIAVNRNALKEANQFTTAAFLYRVESAIRQMATDHEIDKNFLHIADINYREALDHIATLTQQPINESTPAEVYNAIQEAKEFLADENPTNTEDRYTEGVMGDGAVFLKDGAPLTISQVLDILNGRTRR